MTCFKAFFYWQWPSSTYLQLIVIFIIHKSKHDTPQHTLISQVLLPPLHPYQHLPCIMVVLRLAHPPLQLKNNIQHNLWLLQLNSLAHKHLPNESTPQDILGSVRYLLVSDNKTLGRAWEEPLQTLGVHESIHIFSILILLNNSSPCGQLQKTIIDEQLFSKNIK